MTIKKRLFRSNVLMFVLPIVLFYFFMFSIGTIGKYTHLFKTLKLNEMDKENFEDVKLDIGRKFNRKDLSFDDILSKTKKLNSKYNSNNINLSIIDDKSVVYGNTTDLPINIFELKGSHTFVFDTLAIYVYPVGDYRIVLIDTQYEQIDMHEYHDFIFIAFITMVSAACISILLTNLFLTRRILKPITDSLNTLSEGVKQIRDNHLGYRIYYDKKDEFLPVCNDFNEMAERLEKMIIARQKDEESRKELIAGISHDLRTPLTSIKAYIEGIEKGVASTKELQEKYITIIKNKSNDLEHIIEQLFLFSKIDLEEFALDLEVLEINKFLEEIISEHYSEYKEKGLILSFEPFDNNINIELDLQWFRNVLINVFENSSKYKDKECVSLNISIETTNNKIKIILEDDGPGVLDECLEHMFEVFYRGDPSRNSKGSGLGLAISSKIINKMNGIMYAKNSENGGLVVMIEFNRNK